MVGQLPELDLSACLLAASAFQIQTGDSGSEQGHRGRLRHGVVGSRELKLDAVIPEVTIRIESESDVVST